jgi:hypothetical protein
MALPTGCVMHIPDEWNREKKNTAKVPARQQSRVASGAGGSTTSISNESTECTTEKKRKRPKSSVISDIVDGDDNTDNITMMDTTTTHPMSQEVSTASIQTSVSSVTSQRLCDETESIMRGLYYQVEKLARLSGCALQEGIHLDSIMTHIPYAEVLQQMFGGNSVKDTPSVPVVTRAYEESYMREALTGVENSCVMGSNCECQFIDEHNPFIGVQFTLPVEAFSGSNIGSGMAEELSSNKLCVLCCRKNTQSLFYDALYNHRAYNACIQLYGNICDSPGEYAKEAMLICPLSGPIHNMPLPVVAHQRNRYSVVVHNGVRQLRQYRVGYEDFHVPSSSRC